MYQHRDTLQPPLSIFETAQLVIGRGGSVVVVITVRIHGGASWLGVITVVTRSVDNRGSSASNGGGCSGVILGAGVGSSWMADSRARKGCVVTRSCIDVVISHQASGASSANTSSAKGAGLGVLGVGSSLRLALPEAAVAKRAGCVSVIGRGAKALLALVVATEEQLEDGSNEEGEAIHMLTRVVHESTNVLVERIKRVLTLRQWPRRSMPC